MANFVPAYLYYQGKKFICPCGNGDFKLEEASDPARFWCSCGTYYTEESANTLILEQKEMEKSGE